MTITSKELTVVTPANHVPGPKQGCWTYDHYLALPDDGQRYEIVDGVLYMAPAPTPEHQNVVLWIAHYLLIHAKLAGLGQVYVAPIDVVLPSKTVVQPDVTVISVGVFSGQDTLPSIVAPAIKAVHVEQFFA